MYVCKYVCTYVRTYIRTYVCIHVYTQEQKQAHNTPRYLAALIRNRPSSSAISLFSSRLFSVGSTLRSAFSIPSNMSMRPFMAARTGACSVHVAVPPHISRLSLRSDSVVSLVCVCVCVCLCMYVFV